jgi:hypothetical protein
MNSTTPRNITLPPPPQPLVEAPPRFFVHHTKHLPHRHALVQSAPPRARRAGETSSWMLPVVAAHPDAHHQQHHHPHHYIAPSAIHHRHPDGASVLGVLVLFVVYVVLVLVLIATSTKPSATHQSDATTFGRPVEELQHGYSLPLKDPARAATPASVPPAAAPANPILTQSAPAVISSTSEAAARNAASARREKALDLLKKGRQFQADAILYRQMLAEVVRNYGDTPAGAEALNLLATFNPVERTAPTAETPATRKELPEVIEPLKQDTPKVTYGLGFMKDMDPTTQHPDETIIRPRVLPPNSPETPGAQEKKGNIQLLESPDRTSGEEQKRADFLAAYNGQRADRRLVAISKLNHCKAQRSIETLYFVSWFDADPEVRSRAFSALVHCEDTYGYTAYLAADSFKRENEPGVKVEKAVAMGSLRYRWSALNELVGFLGSLRWRWWGGWNDYSRSGGYVRAGTPPPVSSTGPAPVQDSEYDLWRQREPLRWRSENELMAIVVGVINRLSGTSTESRPRIDQEIVKWWDRKSELWTEYDRKLREKTLSDSKPVHFKDLQGMRDDEIQPGKDTLQDIVERMKKNASNDKAHKLIINDE